VVKYKAGRPPGEPGVRKYVECETSSLQCFDTVGWLTERAAELFTIFCSCISILEIFGGGATLNWNGTRKVGRINKNGK